VASIAVLPPVVADQIAAGEVVERPASVVKELLENSLDAGAEELDVEVEDGGRRLVRVSDDGCGMDREDALLSLARHATSKIRSVSDLVGVRTFGFRGEALPAIASVSRLEILTAAADGSATLIRALGGRIELVEEATRRRGTTVVVEDLFFNTPARRKFLRTARSEWRAVHDSVVALSLAQRQLKLRLQAEGREALALGRASSLRERVAAIWGLAYSERFVDVDLVQGTVRVSGLAERPALAGGAARRVVLVVNGRVVRDAGLVRAAEAGYRSSLPAGVRPSLFLEIQVPGDAVDVNVHPAKAEVRFHDRWGVERVVEGAIRRALGTMHSAASLGTHNDSPRTSPAAVPWQPEQLFGLVREAGGPGASWPSAEQPTYAVTEVAERVVQLRQTFLLVEQLEGVLIVDQHSAHERVLYERLLTAAPGGTSSQPLLLPEAVKLSAAELEVLEEHRGELYRLGFELEDFGGDTVLVRAVPALHPRCDPLRALRETLADMTGDRWTATGTRQERLMATLACKLAIKAGETLTQEEMLALLRDLRSTSLPAHDVHGRSAVLWLSWDELERRFGRR
jgi:DNA mismatch repair protein MutL